MTDAGNNPNGPSGKEFVELRGGEKPVKGENLPPFIKSFKKVKTINGTQEDAFKWEEEHRSEYITD